MFVFLAVTTVLLTAIYWWYRNVYVINKCLERFPGPKTIPILGNALQLGDRITMLHNLLDFQRTYGGIYTLKIGPLQPNLVLTDYKAVEFLLKSNTLITKSDMYSFFHNWLGDGLIFSTGEKWKRHRKILTPAFHLQILEQFIQNFDSASDILVKKLTKSVNKGSIDIFPELLLCSLDIICESAMNSVLNAQNEPESEYVTYTHDMCKIIVDRTFSPFKMFDFLYLFTKDYWREKKLLKVIHEYPMRIIKSRKEAMMNNQTPSSHNAGGKTRLAFLDILLQARIEGKPLSDRDIRDEVDTFMFTGHDTTATTTSFLMYCLSKHLDVQNKVIKELKTIFGDDLNRPATMDELNDMKYLDMVVKETLRLYPAAPLLSRKLQEDVEYDGGMLPKGLTLIVFIFGIHRNPEYFPDPEKFDPERFSPENSDRSTPYSYIPFSAGPRNCIGQKFAMLEIKSIISKLLRHFELLPTVPGHNVILSNEIVLKSANGVLIRLKKRQFNK